MYFHLSLLPPLISCYVLAPIFSVQKSIFSVSTLLKTMLASPSLTIPLHSSAASFSGLRGLAQTQSWLLYKRVSGGRGAAGEGGEDTESQATGKNGLITTVQHLRPQSNTIVVLHNSFFLCLSLSQPHYFSLVSAATFLSFSFCAPLSLLAVNCPQTVVEEQSVSPGTPRFHLGMNRTDVFQKLEYFWDHPLMFSYVILMQQQISLLVRLSLILGNAL